MQPNSDLTVLMFHGLRREIPEYAKYRGYSSYIIQDRDFEKCISWCHNNAKVISLGDVQKYLDGEATEPGILITFDDGLRSVIDIGCPILNHYNVSALVFLTTGWIDNGIEPSIFGLERQLWHTCPLKIGFRRGDFDFEAKLGSLSAIPKVIDALWRFCFKNQISPLSIRQEEFIFDGQNWQASLDVNVVQDWEPANWREIQKAVKTGTIEIGLHGVSHTPWAWMTEEQLENEASESISRVSQEIGIIPTSFSFPHGSTNELSFKSARKYFDLCFTSEAQKVKSRIDLNKGIPRFNVFSDNPVNINLEINYPKIARFRRALINSIKSRA